ncbi:MAG TPA: T9SS type A sorting domain-containing protein [Flavipsychrobacter sp.]|nr:T9SS type A sorting domain-containing protein [Flavipsychrobacter sp.]
MRKFLLTVFCFFGLVASQKAIAQHTVSHDTLSTANSTIASDDNAGSSSIFKINDDVVLYPNPAKDQLNVVFNEDANIKNIAIYNLIGKMQNVYRVNGNNAGLDISALPSGVYFIRFIDNQGSVIATRRFTHE